MRIFGAFNPKIQIIMAKGNPFLGQARGKVGDIVLYRAYGEQITRSRNKHPRNPDTALQMAQRLIFTTVSQASKFLLPVVDHAFERYSSSNDNLKRFRRVNLDRLRTLCSQDFEEGNAGDSSNVWMTMKSTSVLVPNSYIISEGTLADAVVTVVSSRSAEIRPISILFPDLQVPVSGTSTITPRAILSAVLGLSQDNDQLTLVTINKSSMTDVYTYISDLPGAVVANTAMTAMRLVMSPNAALDTPVSISTATAATVIASAIRQLDPVKSDAQLLNYIATRVAAVYDSAVVADGYLTAAPGENQGNNLDGLFGSVPATAAEVGVGHVYAAGIIMSRQSGTSWLRSNCTMVTSSPGDDGTNFGLDWLHAPTAWRERKQVADSEQYLDNGGDQDRLGPNF